MKATLPLFAALVLVFSVGAQVPLYGAPESEYGPEQLDQLLAPIALYPDPLLAVILPASTMPSDVALAAQFLQENGSPAGIDAQPWDPSVKALAHYPDVLKWMNDNPDWLHSLGAAFAMQQADVMKSVQQLRAKALAAGTLASTPQQQVDTEGDDIRIVPAEAQQIYVPQYDPEVVYDVPDGYAGPFITFGIGFPVGPWLGYECDWDDFGVWYGPWHPGWEYRRDWRNPSWGGNRWHPDQRSGHDLVHGYYRPSESIPRTRPMVGARVVARPAEAPRARVAAPVSRPDYRGWNQGAAARPATPAPSGPLYGGYNRGTQARDFSSRGNASRQAPVKSPARAQGGNSGGRSPAPAQGGDHREKH